MIKLQELLKNQKPEKIKVDILTKTPLSVSAVVKDKYRCEIQKEDSDNWSADSKVKVYCSCPDFQFRWAYVLYQYKALLYPENFVLEPPKERNPGMKLGACKHLAALAREILSETEKKKES